MNYLSDANNSTQIKRKPVRNIMCVKRREIAKLGTVERRRQSPIMQSGTEIGKLLPPTMRHINSVSFFSLFSIAYGVKI